MPTYSVVDSSGKVLASGIQSWCAAARLADSFTIRFRNLAVVSATAQQGGSI